MLIRRLELENFRCFAEAKLEFGMGLIGVRGRNGAGKTSLLEAVDFALYGNRRLMPPRRSSAARGEPFRVFVELDIDARKIEVERRIDTATLRVDSGPPVNGLSEVTKEVSRLIGLSRRQFDSTYYARQKEVQSFGDPKTRRESLERLLGLTQLTCATELAKDDLRRQTVVAETLQEDGAKLQQANEALEQARETATAAFNELAQAKQEHQNLQAKRAQAEEGMESCQQRVDEARSAQAELRLCEEQLTHAVDQRAQAQAAVTAAVQAAAEVEHLQPEASRLAQLDSAVREHESRQQAHEHFLSLKQARADIQRNRAAAMDRLQELPEPTTTSAALAESLTAERNRRDQTAQALLQLGTKAAELSQQHDRALRYQQVRTRLEALEAALVAVPEVVQAEAQARARLAQLTGERAEIERRLASEQSHSDEVRRDGPHAQCLRCHRAYGESYHTILAEFDVQIDALRERLAQLEADAEQARDAQQAAADQANDLQRLTGERDSLTLDQTPPASSAEQIAAAKTALQEQEAASRADLETAEAQLGRLEEQFAQARQQELDRQEFAQAVEQLRGKDELLSNQMEALGHDGYNSEAHAELAKAHAAALVAAQRCSELRQLADGRELAERRSAATKQALVEAQSRRDQASEAAEDHEDDEVRLDQAKEAVRQLDAAIRTSNEVLLVAERRSAAEQQLIRGAEADVKRARNDRRKVQAAERTRRLADLVASGLESYTAHMQREAVPMLEKDTASFLAQLTANRYTDVKLDDRGALEIFDDGKPRPLRRFSGGEQDLAHLCLRLALSRTFAGQRGADPGLIILDEVFGSQDTERRQSLLEHFRELETVFSQVFIVSHFDDVADRCDIQVQVTRKGTISTAEIAA